MKNEQTPDEGLLKEGRTTLFKMKGNSMHPVLKDGDVGMVQQCDPEKLRIGDIVVFKLRDSFVAHRLIKIQRKSTHTIFTARGDKNLFNDPPFTAEALAGQIIQFTRGKKIFTTADPKVRRLTAFSKTFRKVFIPMYNLNFRVKAYRVRLFSHSGCCAFLADCLHQTVGGQADQPGLRIPALDEPNRPHHPDGIRIFTQRHSFCYPRLFL
ncbi:MAG: signal peptidase I [Bacteroidia bacterium]|nr:signal peptidase I [Bacteroidia bacterium]